MNLREHIPVPNDNLFKSILSFASRPKVIFSLGHLSPSQCPTVIESRPSKSEIEKNNSSFQLPQSYSLDTAHDQRDCYANRNS